MNSSYWIEQGVAWLSFLLLTAYHIHLMYQVRRAPLTTAIGLNMQTRRAWVETIMADRLDILAVQTLRNSSMAASFLATTAILICLGTLNAAFVSSTNGGLRVISELSHENSGFLLIKLLLLIISFFFAFFNFTLAIRSYNRAGFMINIPQARDPLMTPEFVARVLGRGMNHYSLGMRGYYLSVPLVLWLFGPYWLAAGTVVLLFVMYKIDYSLD
jgi:uncharacterized membrane protein